MHETPDGACLGIGTDGVGIVIVQIPALWVLYDILADGAQGAFVPDDVFVVVALPDRGAGGIAQLVDPFGNDGFEPGDERSQ